MPTKNPRLSITLTPSLAAQLRKLSELTGNSQSAIIGDLLEGSGPVFERMIKVLQAAQTATQSMKGRLAKDMDSAQAKMEKALGLAMEGFDQVTGSLFDEAEAITRRSNKEVSGAASASAIGRTSAAGQAVRGGADLPRSTPISNRGVRFNKTTPKTIADNPSPQRSKATKTDAKTRGGK